MEAVQARLCLHLPKCHIVGNHMMRLKCQLVWRMPKERFDELNVAEHDRYGKGSVMVWAGISVNGKTDLYVIENGLLMALRYCNEILHQFVRPYASAIGPEFILMDDNAGPHHVHITNAS